MGKSTDRNNKITLYLLFIITLLTVVSGCDLYNPFNHYNETHRPQYHFSPPSNWMGAPGAMVYYRGDYHLFYVQNRAGNNPEAKSWGHAVSRNLVSWEHLPAAFSTEEDRILPGSVVVDWENTAGFVSSGQEPAMVAFYTTEKEEDAEINRYQQIAYSTDSGRTWVRNEKDPVLNKEEGNLRDPKVFWHDSSEKWIMALAVPEEQKISFYGSPDLKNWEKLSEFASKVRDGTVEADWERPELFELPVDGTESNKRWILQVNVSRDAAAGGSGAFYFVGEFTGEEFREDPEAGGQTRWVNYGRDFYGAISFSNIPGSDNRRIWMGWMNNWEYAENIPTAPWIGALTIPREVQLRTIDGETRMVQQPVVELRSLRAGRHRFRNRNLTEESNFLRETGITGKSAALIAEFEPGNARSVGFELRRGTDERTIVGYDTERKELFVDRTESGNTGFDTTFAGRQTAPLETRDERIKMRIFLDRSSVEVFGNEGEAVITAQIFPDPGSDGMALYIRGGEARLTSLDIWRLESIW